VSSSGIGVNVNSLGSIMPNSKTDRRVYIAPPEILGENGEISTSPERLFQGSINYCNKGRSSFLSISSKSSRVLYSTHG